MRTVRRAYLFGSAARPGIQELDLPGEAPRWRTWRRSLARGRGRSRDAGGSSRVDLVYLRAAAPQCRVGSRATVARTRARDRALAELECLRTTRSPNRNVERFPAVITMRIVKNSTVPLWLDTEPGHARVARRRHPPGRAGATPHRRARVEAAECATRQRTPPRIADRIRARRGRA